MIETLGVVGAGTMGRGIAQVAVARGLAVVVSDPVAAARESGHASITKGLDRWVEKGQLSADERAAAGERLTFTDTLDALRDAEFVIEAAPEDTDLKARIFADLDRICPPTVILASNTSSISITRLGAATRRPAQVIGMHFFNPVPLMALIEVVRGLETDDATHGATVALAERLGKTPVTVRDAPGFVANRVLMPLINEAVFALQEGLASVTDIDTVFKLGMNHPMGPLALADLIGLDVTLDILEVLHRELGEDKYRPCALLRQYVAAGWLGRKTGRGFYTYDEA